MTLINGKEAANYFSDQLAINLLNFKEKTGVEPHLAAILVGQSGPSETYVAAKMEACKKIGFRSSLIRFDSDISESELIAQIKVMNADKELHGFIVQLPLPEHISVDRVIESIDPEKDVDGFHPINLGKMAKGQKSFASATPWGIIKLLQHYNIETEGKHVVVLGRSQIVGLPMSLLLSRNSKPGNATVTICHSKTKDLKTITLQADILVAALGVPEFLKGDMIKEGVVVIDVGISRLPDESKKSGYRLVGDVDFDSVSPKSSAITPVPGGVGPMTIIALMENTLTAAQNQWESCQRS
jgi:methylenetetrahydrofolate dehydrogenase (NADP+)/methenyltetrahydrofolate cyclohydrolase